MRNGLWLVPTPCVDLAHCVRVLRTNPESHLFRRNYGRMGPFEEWRELSHGAGTGKIKRSDLFGQLLIAAHKNANARKSKLSNDFSEECGLFHIRFDEKKIHLRSSDFHRNTRKTASGTYVGQPTLPHRQ